MHTTPNPPRTGSLSASWLRLPLVLLGALFAAALPVTAQTLYWDTNGNAVGSSGAAGTWGTNTYWSTSSAGTNATTAYTSGRDTVFSAGTNATGTYTVTVSGTQNTSSISVEEGTVTFSGGTINFSDATPDFIVASGLTTTVSSVLSGTNGLTKGGAGTLIYSTANTYTGATTVSAGTLLVNSSDLITATSALSVASGATFTLNYGANQTVASLSGAGTVDLRTNIFTVGDAASTTFSGVITDEATVSGRIVKQGTGTLTLTGANTYGGLTTINAGAINIQNNTALGTSGTGATVASGAALEMQGNITSTGQGLTLNGTGVGTNGALRNVSGANTWAGNIALGSATKIQSDAGTLTLSGNLTATNLGLTLDGAGNIALSGTVGLGTGTLTKNGAGTATLSAANTYTGTTTVNAGTLAYGVSNAISSGAVTVSGGTLAMGTYSDTVGAVTLASGSITGTTGVLTGTSYDLQGGSVSASLGGTASLTKTTSGTVTISGTAANTFSGTTSISDGTLNLNKTAGVNALGAGAITVGDGTGAAGSANLVLLASNQIASTNAVTLNSDGRLALNNFTASIATLSGTGLVDLSTSGYLTVGADNSSSSFSGSISGTGTLEKAGTGILTFNSTINYGGTLLLSGNGGTLRLNGITATINTLTLTGNTTIDFAGSMARLYVTNLNLNGFTLTITNWANATDYFFATNWSGATLDTRNAAPMNQVTFNGFTAANTLWQSYDHQVTPVPEPGAYGVLLLGGLTILFLYRRSGVAAVSFRPR